MAEKIVVVGVDGSESSIEALREAASYARMLNADLRAVTTWNFVAYEDAGVFDPEQDAKEIGGDAVKTVFGTPVPEWVTVVTTLGPAGEALVRESKDAELLVVGSRGRTALAGLLLGSVSTHCAEHAECSVLVVHGRDHGRSSKPPTDAAADAS